MSFLRVFTVFAGLVLGAVAAAGEGAPPVLLVVMDGLRPDYVTPELMPNLAAFAEANVTCSAHHSVYPTVTRVNATSIVTGCYPERHGVLDNTIYLPEVDSVKALDTSERADMEKAEAATQGNLIQVPTLGEILADSGKALFVASSGSSGSAFLLNHKVKAGAIVHCEYTLPAALDAHVKDVLGPVPPESTPDSAWNARVTDAYLKINLDEMKAPVAILWYTDPDHTAHVQGIGTPITKDALKDVDTQFGRLLAGLKDRGLEGKVNLLVTSDHGFSTGLGTASYNQFINEYLAEKNIDPATVVRAGYGLYFKQDADKILPDLTMKLQTLPWIGAIFTAAMIPGAPFGVNPGAMSFNTIRYENPRDPAIVVSPDWNDDANAAGFKGSTTAKGHGHGSSSPWDVHNTLIAGGPAFKEKLSSPAPTANVDLAPTILRLAGLPGAKTMQGRVIEEALKQGPDPAALKPAPRVFRAQMSIPEGEGTTYTLEVHTSEINGASYFDYAKATRTQGQTAPSQAQFLGPGTAGPQGTPAPRAPRTAPLPPRPAPKAE